MRSRLLTAALAVALLLTIASMAYVRHEARRSFMALQDMEEARDDLTVDFGNLQLEYATWAEGGRVEGLARNELGLEDATPERVNVILK